MVVLLPHLPEDMEGLAWDAAAERLAGDACSQAREHLERLTPEDLFALLALHAGERWQSKCGSAGRRSSMLGWTEACHHAALESLGCRFNRATMLKVAQRWPLKAWGEPGFDSDRVHASMEGLWAPHCGRPANHPRNRLRQYSQWCRLSPEWPELMFGLLHGLPPLPAGGRTAEVRRSFGFGNLRTRLHHAITGATLSGPRLDTLVCDAFLPLCAVREGPGDASWWFHWFAGDAAPPFNQLLRKLGTLSPGSQPACNGLCQALIGYCLGQNLRP